MKLRVRALGLAIGIVWGVGVFAATLLSLQIGKGETIGTLSVILIGYTVSVGGAFLGLLWGIIYGFVCGALIALLYNIFHKMVYKSSGSAA